MKKRSVPVIVSLICAAFLFSCHPHSGVNEPAPLTEIKEDTLRDADPARPDNFFVPVYQVSPHTLAMTFSMPEESRYMDTFDRLFIDMIDRDSLFFSSGLYRTSIHIGSNHHPLNVVSYDTTGPVIFRDTVFEAKMLRRINPSYYIYGTKGVMQCRSKNVVYYFGACDYTYFAITIDGYDSARCGHALFSYPALLPVHYGGDYSGIQTWLNEEKAAELSDSSNNYQDKIYPVVFAHMDSTYFAYSDDFGWSPGSNKMPTCLFPQRMILRGNGAVPPKVIWSSVLDNFGVPCD